MLNRKQPSLDRIRGDMLPSGFIRNNCTGCTPNPLSKSSRIDGRNGFHRGGRRASAVGVVRRLGGRGWTEAQRRKPRGFAKTLQPRPPHRQPPNLELTKH